MDRLKFSQKSSDKEFLSLYRETRDPQTLLQESKGFLGRSLATDSFSGIRREGSAVQNKLKQKVPTQGARRMRKVKKHRPF